MQYTDYASITQKIGVYTARDYAAILTHPIDFWLIEQVTGLNERSRRAQDYLCALPARYQKLAERTKEPEEAQLRWLK